MLCSSFVAVLLNFHSFVSFRNQSREMEFEKKNGIETKKSTVTIKDVVTDIMYIYDTFRDHGVNGKIERKRGRDRLKIVCLAPL